jgi:hypothetical protein
MIRKAIKTLVFANRPCTRAWSTRLAIGYNLRVKIEVKIFFLRMLRAKIQFPGLLHVFSLLHDIFSYNPHTILKKCATRSTKKYIYFYSQEQYSSKANSSNVRDFLAAKSTVCRRSCVCVLTKAYRTYVLSIVWLLNDPTRVGTFIRTTTTLRKI